MSSGLFPSRKGKHDNFTLGLWQPEVSLAQPQSITPLHYALFFLKKKIIIYSCTRV